MIRMPHRSVTRFFIPLIDVMILLFCIFLLMPVFKEAQRGGAETPSPTEEVADLRSDKDRLERERQRLREAAGAKEAPAVGGQARGAEEALAAARRDAAVARQRAAVVTRSSGQGPLLNAGMAAHPSGAGAPPPCDVKPTGAP